MHAWLARTLILRNAVARRRACPRRPEDKETESMQPYLRGCAGKTNQGKSHDSSRHLAPGANLPTLWLRSRPALWCAPWAYARPGPWPGGRHGGPGEVFCGFPLWAGRWPGGRPGLRFRDRPGCWLRDRQRLWLGRWLRGDGGVLYDV